ncbi:MAG TPA: hypothetical protein VFL64_10770 [Rhizobacter sp.]|nr:hypothetical protein [Rhizobacter sp.]
MKAADPNLAKVELVAAALGPLTEQLVFVGGCAAGLLITDAAAAPVRVTYDVDLTAEVAALSDYHRLESQLAARGFQRDMSKEAPICRWRLERLEVDLMPTDPRILGFANRWYPLVVRTATPTSLPSGRVIRVITAPAFIATKFEAFADRGRGDVLGSHDLEDIFNVLDGRPQLLAEVEQVEPELRGYLAERFRALLETPHFLDYLPGLIAPDESLGERVAELTQRLHRLRALA